MPAGQSARARASGGAAGCSGLGVGDHELLVGLWLHMGYCLLHKLHTRIHRVLLPRLLFAAVLLKFLDAHVRCVAGMRTGWPVRGGRWVASIARAVVREGQALRPFWGCLSAVRSCRHDHTLTIQHQHPFVCPLTCCSGRTQECEVLLPAVATLLRASPVEYRLLRDHLQRGAAGWLPALPSLMGGAS